MAISSQTLFHFTSSASNLINILIHEFRPHFCLEDLRQLNIEGGFPMAATAIPMVCFCDLPLSQTSEHLSFYGNYGIGLTKKWGIKNGLNPVLYLADKSDANKYLTRVAASAFTQENLPDEAFADIVELMSFVKPLDGTMYKQGKPIEKYFYDEREWRFVPYLIKESSDMEGNEYRLDKEEYLDDVRRSHANEELRSRVRLSFEPSDIKYIIVAKDDEIISTIRAIRKIKEKHSSETVDILSSRIISAKQIEEDF